MRKIIVHVDAGYAGMDGYHFVEVADTATDKELDDMAWQMALDHAEMYGIYNRAHYADEEIPEDEEDNYSDNIEGCWEDYNSEKHDMYTIGGTPDWE